MTPGDEPEVWGPGLGAMSVAAGEVPELAATIAAAAAGSWGWPELELGPVFVSIRPYPGAGTIKPTPISIGISEALCLLLGGAPAFGPR